MEFCSGRIESLQAKIFLAIINAPSVWKEVVRLTNKHKAGIDTYANSLTINCYADRGGRLLKCKHSTDI